MLSLIAEMIEWTGSGVYVDCEGRKGDCLLSREFVGTLFEKILLREMIRKIFREYEIRKIKIIRKMNSRLADMKMNSRLVDMKTNSRLSDRNS